jgi:5-methylcytosine-specific restriction enzyme subunit McrC
VGLIQLKNGYQVQILPKISFDKGENTGNKETKRVFLEMLKSMKDFPSKVFNDASLKVDRMNLYEIFINMYLKEARQLVKRGIKSAYVEQENNLKYYKGKLLTSQHIRSNLAHKERFYVAYDEFHPNRPENRLVKATLLKLQKLTSSAENSKEIRQLLTALEMIAPSTNYTKDFSKVIIDRNMKDYEMLMQWSKVFLLNKSFTTFSGKNTSRALLFPMESVYESYVVQQMKKVFGPDKWEVSSQDKGYYLFTKPRNRFALRPDIVCQRGDRTVIMDTKWKNLINNERANYGISQSDMYQMYAYSKKYGTSEIWLLYPLNDEMRGHSEIKFESGDGTTVRIHFVDVARIKKTLMQLRDKLEVTES